jgi:hypothetical protein
MDPISRVLELLDKVQRKIEELRNFVNGVLSKVPSVLGWVVDRFLDAWNWMMGKLGEFWDWFTDKISYAGNPFVLSSASVGWKEKVGGPAVNLTRTLDDANLAADDVWDGFGAGQYRQHLPGQREAMTSIAKDFADNISSAMSTMQLAIVAFWAGVIVAVIALINGISAATAEGVTIIGLPAVPATVVASIVVALAALGTGIWILNSQADSARSTLASASSGVQHWPAFAS